MTFPLPEVSYLMAAHIPLLQGEMPAIAIIRTDENSSRFIKIAEVRGRMFHEHVMSYLAEIAGKMTAFDKTPSIQAHLVVSGQAFGGAEVGEMLAGRWPAGSWSYARLAGGSELPSLDDSDERMPFNQFKLPRMAIVNSINLSYNNPGRIYFSVNADESERLSTQLSKFTERAAAIPANDPDAILEYEGEGLVIATGVALWHHFNSRSVRAGLAREKLKG